jgi:hypothetical protein
MIVRELQKPDMITILLFVTSLIVNGIMMMMMIAQNDDYITLNSSHTSIVLSLALYHMI